MTKPGRPRKPTEPIGGELDQAQDGKFALVTHETVRFDPAGSDAQVAFSQLIGERIGRRKTAVALQKLLTVTAILELQQIKSSKAYRGLKVQTSEKVVTVNRWDDYCLYVEERSREHVDEDLRNIKAFGTEFLEAAQQLGIGYRELREMRQIPADQHLQLIDAANSGDKATLLEVAESLIEQHSRDQQKLEAKHADTEQSLEAARQHLVEKNKELDDTKIELAAVRTFKPRKNSLARTQDEENALNALIESGRVFELEFPKIGNAAADLSRSDSAPLRERALHMMTYLVLQMRQVIAYHQLDVAADDEALGLRADWMDAKA